jgi:hypothetical protein
MKNNRLLLKIASRLPAMPKRPLSGDFTLTWTRKATKWEEDTDTDEEQGSELDKIFWDEEGIWHFWGGDWWILEDRWWRKWVDEQQETANKNSEEHQSINDSPEQFEDDVEDLVNGLVHVELK